MGAGCYYTHNNNEIENRRAFWIELCHEFIDEDGDTQEDEFAFENAVDEAGYILESLGYIEDEQYRWINGLYAVELESTYHGDGIVVRLEPHDEESQGTYNLALANHERSYSRIKRAFLEQFSLRIATSGYTSESLSA